MCDNNLRFLDLAKREALRSREMKRQFGALIADGNRIISIARNLPSHPKIPFNLTGNKTGKKYYGLHAEVNAILKFDGPFKGLSIYVHGQNVRSGKVVLSKPCEICEMIIRDKGFKEMIFRTQAGYQVIKL